MTIRRCRLPSNTAIPTPIPQGTGHDLPKHSKNVTHPHVSLSAATVLLPHVPRGGGFRCVFFVSVVASVHSFLRQPAELGLVPVGVRRVVKRAPIGRLVAAKRAVRALRLPRLRVRAAPLLVPFTRSPRPRSHPRRSPPRLRSPRPHSPPRRSPPRHSSSSAYSVPTHRPSRPAQART